MVSSIGNFNPQVCLGIENIRIIYNYLIPFLKDLLFNVPLGPKKIILLLLLFYAV